MSNILNRFTNKNVGNEQTIFDFLPKITPYGDFKQIKEIDVIITSWNNILSTSKGSYLHDPEYGSNLYKLIFDPMDDTTKEQIKSEILDTISYYDDRAEIVHIEVVSNVTKTGYKVNIKIKYKGDTKLMTLEFTDNAILET